MTERIDERLQAMGVDASEMTDEQKFTAATGLTRYTEYEANNPWYVPGGAANVPAGAAEPTGEQGEVEPEVITGLPYIISGGYNNDITNIDAEGYSASVQFKDKASSYNSRIGASCVGGANWATPLESGKKHTITITLADDDTSNIDLYIAALESEITDKYGTVTPVAYATINTGSSKVLALEVTNNYGAVYIYTTNNGWNLVKITSVECKIENT